MSYNGGWMGKFRRAIGAAKNAAVRAVKTAAAFVQPVTTFVCEHPYWTAAIIALAGTGVALIAPHAVLGVLGWQASGVAEWSIAAWIQSIVYSGFTTGVFSALQSFTAGAAAVPVGMLVAGGISLVSAVAIPTVLSLRGHSRSGNGRY